MQSAEKSDDASYAQALFVFLQKFAAKGKPEIPHENLRLL